MAQELNAQMPTLHSCAIRGDERDSRDACYITSLKKANENQNQFKVSPNPFNNLCNIDFLLTENANVSLTVENLLGKDLYQISYGKLQVGKYTKQINWEQKESEGVYILKLRINNKDNCIKIVKQ